MTETKFDPHTEQLKAKDEMIAYYKEKIEDLEMDRDSLKRMNDDMQEVLDILLENCQSLEASGEIRIDIDFIYNIIKPQKEEQNEQS